MELEGLISHGAENCLKELLTAKSDHESEKRNLIDQIIRNGNYELPENLNSEGGTKKVVSTLIKFLQD